MCEAATTSVVALFNSVRTTDPFPAATIGRTSTARSGVVDCTNTTWLLPEMRSSAAFDVVVASGDNVLVLATASIVSSIACGELTSWTMRIYDARVVEMLHSCVSFTLIRSIGPSDEVMTGWHTDDSCDEKSTSWCSWVTGNMSMRCISP